MKNLKKKKKEFKNIFGNISCKNFNPNFVKISGKFKKKIKQILKNFKLIFRKF